MVLGMPSTALDGVPLHPDIYTHLVPPWALLSGEVDRRGLQVARGLEFHPVFLPCLAPAFPTGRWTCVPPGHQPSSQFSALVKLATHWFLPHNVPWGPGEPVEQENQPGIFYKSRDLRQTPTVRHGACLGVLDCPVLFPLGSSEYL